MSRPAAPRRSLAAAAVTVLVISSAWMGWRVHQTLDARRGTGLAAVPLNASSGSGLASDLGESMRLPAHVPERLPDFALADPSGAETSIHRWDGRALILNFWATWCEPCRREIPLLETLASRWSARGMTVVGVAVDERPQVIAFARSLKIEYPLLVGEEDALAVAAKLGFDSPGFPFTVFTDRRGEVVALYLGELHAAEAELILGEVQAVDERAVPLAEARRTIRAGLARLAATPG